MINPWLLLKSDAANNKKASLIAINSAKLDLAFPIDFEKISQINHVSSMRTPPMSAGSGLLKAEPSTFIFMDPIEGHDHV